MATNRMGHTAMHLFAAFALGVFTACSFCDAFITPINRAVPVLRGERIQGVRGYQRDDDSDDEGRRSVLSTIVSTSAVIVTGGGLFPRDVFAEAETMERGGVPLTPFNSLAFNYRGGDSPTIDSSTLGEASIPYSEFLDKLNSGEVAYVEFLAPSGDAAYVTFKADTNAKIRIGEGYPMEDPGGWSSPAFVIKAVAKKGVPYKFVVPGLEDSFK